MKWRALHSSEIADPSSGWAQQTRTVWSRQHGKQADWELLAYPGGEAPWKAAVEINKEEAKVTLEGCPSTAGCSAGKHAKH